MNDRPTPARPQHAATPPAPRQGVSTPRQAVSPPRQGLHVGPLRVTLPLVVVLVVLVGSVAFLGWVVLAVRDDQIPLLAVGFVALGASFGAMAVGSLVGMWRAASRAEGGRAFVLAVVGGLAGLAAIGCFAVTALFMLVWNT